MIETFLTYLEAEKRCSRHTVLAYRNDLQQFADFAASQNFPEDFSELRHTHVRSWILNLIESGIQPRSVNRKIAGMRSFFRFLLRRGHVTVNPMTKVRPLKVKKSLPNFVPENDMTKLLDHDGVFGDDFQGARDRMIFELLYGTGIRLSELINLKEDNIDLFTRSIKVLGKRNKERIIPFGTGLSETIKRYLVQKKALQGNSSPFFIVTNKGKQAYSVFVYRTVRKYLDMFTTIEKRSPHVLRHTFATHLVNNGAELNAVKDLLGHESLSATQVYTHNTLGKLKEIFDRAHPKA
ncbi:tyrosine recombinase XerC [Fulvitalea axinellae]|uniref:Tyrosine recombinase XerC n=1 Tax=Fulvitalea axinellae TaxID=1182444 RepID=A0AAU9DBM7_9BACT|nr:tyrosine recombinase XerC [Fulvitalea axinellae]